MMFVVLAVATIVVIVGVVPVAIIVDNAMARIVVFVPGHCHHCRPAASTATTVAGVSDAPQPLLPPRCGIISHWSHHGHELLKSLKGLF
jgi:hypothetical protein